MLLGSGSAKAIKDLQLSSGGGAGANVYLSNTDNQIAGYKTSQPTINATEVTKTITASAPNVTAWGEKYLYTLPISTTVIPSGLWTLHLYGYVDSPVGISKVVFRIFKYSSGIETTLYTFNSFEVDDITKADILTSGSGTEVTLLATDYIGVQVGFTTTSTNSRTLTYSIGNGNASYSTNPLPLRHSSLRDKNSESEFQHVTTAQISTWNGKADLSGATFTGAISATNLSGANTGDETLSSIKSKLGQVSTSNDGYLGYSQFIALSSKQDALGFTPENTINKGQANGYTPLDQNGKISTSFLPATVLGALKYQGSWAASVGTYPASPEQGNYWVISTAGTLGSTYYNHNDWLIYNGSSWDKVDNQQTVSSVNGKVGAVTISANELLPAQTSNAGKVLSTDGTNTSWTTPTTGTVTSVGLSSSSVGLTTTGPVTTAGNLSVNVASGYVIPTTTQLSNAATAYSWGNHATAGYATQSWVSSNYTAPFHSGSVFENGTLIVTNIDASKSEGNSFILEATGKSYLQDVPPFNFMIQGYIYADTFINYSGLHLSGYGFGEAKILNYNGYLAFWWPRVSYWNSFQVSVRSADGSIFNRVTSIVDSAEPSSSKKVTVSMKFGLNTYNYTSYCAKPDGSNATGTWPISISGNSATATTANGFQMSLDAADGKVLTSNGFGVGSWQTPAYSSGTYVPTYSNVGSGITAISTDVGLYYKIGNIVHVNLRVIISANAGTYWFKCSLPSNVSGSYSGLNVGTCFSEKYAPISTERETNTASTSIYTLNGCSNTVINLTFDYVSDN